MASTYSSLKIELIGNGEQSGTWGNTTNTNLGTAIEEAIVGRATANFSSDANLTLTLTDTNATQVARNFVLNVTSGVSLSTTRDLIVPAIEKPYVVQNNTTGGQSIRVIVAGTGITVPNGKTAFVYNDGTNVVTALDFLPELSVDNINLNGNTISSTNTNGNITLAPNGSGRVQVSGTSSNSGGIELFEDTDNGTNKVTLTVPASIASDVTATIPATTTTLAGLAVVQTFSVSQRGTVTTDNDGSFDMNATNNFLCTPTGGFALTFTNITAGQSGNIILVNGSNYAITAAAATKVASTTLATISATGTYWLSYYSPDGTNVYVANTAALA